MNHPLQLLLWVSLLGIVSYGLWTTILFRQKLRISQHLIATSTPFTAIGHTPRVLIAGDSTAVGVGADNPAQSIAGRIHQDFPASTITNLGQSGLKTADLATKLQNFSSDQSYDLVLLQIGGNDITNWTPLPQLKTSIQQVITQAQHHAPRIVLMTSGNVGAAPIFPWFLRPLFHSRTLQVRQLFQSQAVQHHIDYIDLYQPPAKDPFLQDTSTYFAADSFHPSGPGYGLWYQHLSPVVHQHLHRHHNSPPSSTQLHRQTGKTYNKNN